MPSSCSMLRGLAGLLCVVAGACSDAAAPSPVTVDASIEPIAAPAAPVAPADPPAPHGCSSVLVGCTSPVGYASSDRATCRIELPAPVCADLGIAAGEAVDPRTLLDAPFPALHSPVDLYGFCATKHEARHTLDAPSVRNCASEVAAYDVSIACLRAFETTICAIAGAPTWCDHVPGYVDGSGEARDLNACLCELGATCAACLTACESGRSTVPSICEESAQAYCAVNGK